MQKQANQISTGLNFYKQTATTKPQKTENKNNNNQCNNSHHKLKPCNKILFWTIKFVLTVQGLNTVKLVI